MFESKNKTAVTLVEILIVVAVISILMSIVLGVANSIRSQSKQQLTETTISLLGAALQQYYDFNDEFPPQTKTLPVNDGELIDISALLYDELQKLPDSRKVLNKIGDSQIEYGESLPPRVCDGWGTEIFYFYDKQAQTFPTLISAGPDRNFEMADDNITNK